MGYSKIVEIFFEIFKCHLILIHFDILEAILNFTDGNPFVKGGKNGQDILRSEIALFIPVETVEQIHQLLLYIFLLEGLIKFCLELCFSE